MANHKRGKARNARAGCKMCKRWKINSSKCSQWKPSELKARQLTEDDFEDVCLPEGLRVRLGTKIPWDF